MIRIEVHGMANMSEFGSREFAFREKILDAIKQEHAYLLSEVVIMRCMDFGVNAEGAPQPHFLRIYCSKCNDFVGLEKALKPLGLELEFLKLDKFCPA